MKDERILMKAMDQGTSVQNSELQRVSYSLLK